MKYTPDYPERFASIGEARAWMNSFIYWYNYEHRHSGIGLHTPASVHDGTAEDIRDQRQRHALVKSNRPPHVSFDLTRFGSLHYLHVEAMAASESYPTLTLPCDSIAVTAGLVASGLGVAAMPTSTLLLTRFARLVTRPLVAPAVSRPIYVVTVDKDPGSAVSMVVDKIQQFFKTSPIPS